MKGHISTRVARVATVIAAVISASLLSGATPGSAAAAATAPHHPLYMPNAANMNNPTLQPPAVCCLPTGLPPAGQPAMVNMAYFGGHVQVTPKIYLVFWGWGQSGAFDHTTPGMPTYDPDGAAARMSNFTAAIGGTAWAGVSTQYYETVNGQNVYITNPTTTLGGVWYDNINPIHDNVSGLELAQEAQRAVAHFGATDLQNSQFVIAQPQKFNEAGFNGGAGYCAWHDYTLSQSYPGVKEGISFTNMPYVLNSGISCGQNSVNSGYYAGRLDGFSIVLGHEMEETITDPGAGATVNGVSAGGWYDYNGYENGDKCAWVGNTGVTSASTVPGGENNITGNDGKLYPVQSLWSNDSAGGVGYCAGAADDLPVTG
jgi:serine protease